MQAARLRLIASALLFAGWIGWLAYLAATTTKPIVLSRPQFLFSTLDVVAQVDAKGGQPVEKVTVLEVHWPPHADAFKGQSIIVANLKDCARKESGWTGPGEYILPLEKVDQKDDHFEVVKIPESPGFPERSPKGSPNRYRIYRRTPETMRQLESIQKPDHSMPIEVPELGGR
jgi:hypothetical protein